MNQFLRLARINPRISPPIYELHVLGLPRPLGRVYQRASDAAGWWHYAGTGDYHVSERAKGYATRWTAALALVLDLLEQYLPGQFSSAAAILEEHGEHEGGI